MSSGETFLDVTRLVSRAWTKRRSTGIDRVSEAYCRHLQSRARAVVQHRGVVRILNIRDSSRFFDMLLNPPENFRREFLRFASRVFPLSPSRIDGNGAIYINTSHTDFDLPTHHQWVSDCDLRAVYFLHDLIPLTHPRLTSPHAVKRHLGRVQGALRYGAGAIVNTKATRSELAAFARRNRLAIPPVMVAPLAGGSFATGNTMNRVLPEKPYFVCIGTVERRKNYRMMLRIWDELEREYGQACPQLFVFGQKGPQSEEILSEYHAKPQLHGLVRFLTDAKDCDIGPMMKGARALLMPTHAEGYGLPVVEALQMNVPVIASDIPSFREIGQGIPFLLDINEEAQWKRAIGRFAFANHERDRQLRMMGRFEAPTWQKHFAILDPWLDQLGEDKRVTIERMTAEC